MGIAAPPIITVWLLVTGHGNPVSSERISTMTDTPDRSEEPCPKV